MTPIKRFPEAEFWFREIVYLRVSSEKRPGMVIGISIRETQLVYEVQCDTSVNSYFGFELSTEYIPDWQKSE